MSENVSVFIYSVFVICLYLTHFLAKLIKSKYSLVMKSTGWEKHRFITAMFECVTDSLMRKPIHVLLLASCKRYSACVSVGDGRMGYTEEAPYDAIHVGAAAPTVPQAVSLSEYL